MSTTDEVSGKQSSDRWRFMGDDKVSNGSHALRLRGVEERENGEGEGQGELDLGGQARLLSKMGRPQPHL